MGEAKRRKQALGFSYGQSIELEKCAMPAEITLDFADDDAVVSIKNRLAAMPYDFKSVMLASVLQSQENSEPGIVFAEAMKFSGGKGVEINFRNDIETFVQSRCTSRSQANGLIEKLKKVDYSNYRVLGLLGGSRKPTLAINVYTLSQLEILVGYLEEFLSES